MIKELAASKILTTTSHAAKTHAYYIVCLLTYCEKLNDNQGSLACYLTWQKGLYRLQLRVWTLRWVDCPDYPGGPNCWRRSPV